MGGLGWELELELEVLGKIWACCLSLSFSLGSVSTGKAVSELSDANLQSCRFGRRGGEEGGECLGWTGRA